MKKLNTLLADIRKCSVCVDTPIAAPLPHDPRPVLQASSKARLAIFGQAPGNLVHQTGKPFTDPSGDRLRDWMGVTAEEFYNPDKLVIAPMGFCFPGYDKKGSDLPPRKECALAWRERLMSHLPNIETALLVGAYAQKWHLKDGAEKTLTATVSRWRDFAPKFFPMPHPSWRNNAWLKRNPWFESELLPDLRERIRSLI
ncbi:MAG: uracil-DNA glycosylase family protein [Pseudomonadota bacterium]